MLAVCSEKIVRQCRTSGKDSGLLLGQTVDGDVYRVTGACSTNEAVHASDIVGTWTRSAAAQEEIATPGCLVLAIKPDGATFWWREADGLVAHPVPSMIFDLEERLFARQRAIVDQKRLSSKVVAVFGVGSVGSGIAHLLAPAGVGGFVLVDPDRLEAQNVIRHLCGISDIGRYKVDAVAERLRDKNPDVGVTALPVDAGSPGILEFALGRCDLVVAATDSPQAQLRINSACLLAGKPALFAGVYSLAFGGEVLRVIPGKTPCLRCAYDATADLFNRAEPGDEGKTRPYGTDRAHPGLWIDVGPINHLAARMAVETLQDLCDPKQNLVGNYLLWGNRGMWVFRHPLDHRWLTIPRNASCPACGGSDELGARLAEKGLTREDADGAGRKILDTIQEEDVDGAHFVPASALEPVAVGVSGQ